MVLHKQLFGRAYSEANEAVLMGLEVSCASYAEQHVLKRQQSSSWSPIEGKVSRQGVIRR
jgi:hypothetical protein